MRKWSLSTQFAAVGSVIMAVAMLLAGSVTARVVSQAAVENTASSTALFLHSFLEPLTQDLADTAILPDGRIRELNRLLGEPSFRRRFPYLEIWRDDGLVAYSTTPELIGRRFQPPAGLLRGMAGEVSAQYTDLQAREHVVRSFETKYLEVYVPIREHLSGRVIAVAEIHENAQPLEDKLWELRVKSWLAVSASTVLIMASLFWVVFRGNRTIVHQRHELEKRLAEIEASSRQVEMLKDRVQQASGRVSEMTERLLRRLGADLHDGPAQLVALAALKVEHVRRAATSEERERQLSGLDGLLADAVRDIRAVSKGLSLPEIEEVPLAQVLDRAVRAHEQRTGTSVALRCGELPDHVPPAVKICVYRFLQEGLNNAFRHAGGAGQTVTCASRGPHLTVTVQDSGGAPQDVQAPDESGLGLVGLRERVESLGGALDVVVDPLRGTKVMMSLDVEAVSSHD